MAGLAAIRRLGALLICLAALGGAWMLLVDTSSIAEYVACAVAALMGTLATALVEHENVAPLSAHRVFATALPKQIVRVPADMWLLVRELYRALTGRHAGGRFHSVPFEGGEGSADNARRAAIELLGSLAPNTIVLGVDDEQAIVHQLAARASARNALAEIGARRARRRGPARRHAGPRGAGP